MGFDIIEFRVIDTDSSNCDRCFQAGIGIFAWLRFSRRKARFRQLADLRGSRFWRDFESAMRTSVVPVSQCLSLRFAVALAVSWP